MGGTHCPVSKAVVVNESHMCCFSFQLLQFVDVGRHPALEVNRYADDKFPNQKNSHLVFTLGTMST